MNLSFINPWFLLGLAAGIIPILIHRLTPQKALLKRFSAVRLLLKSQQLLTRPRSLRHLLLLALRVLAVMSLAILMARPVLMRAGLLSPGEESAKVVILDNSLSMAYREGDGERFEIAKRAARAVIEGSRGQFLVVPTASFGEGVEAAGDPPWLTREEALGKVEATLLSYGRGDPVSAFRPILRRLKESKAKKEILVITDLAQGDWEAFHPGKLETVPTDATLTFLRVGGPHRDPNTAIRAVRLAEGEAVIGTPSRLEVTVSNLSDQAARTLVQLHLSGAKVDQKSLELKGDEERKVSFELFLEKPGWVNAEVRLSGDALALDDVFYFPLKVREKVRVLIVDGDPRTALKASESYYLVNALHPGGLEGSPFLSQVVTEGEWQTLDSKPHDALFLLNVAQPVASNLSRFLESGKPVFLFLGNRVTPEEYNRIPLFPWKLREVKEAGLRDTEKPERIAQIDKTWSALRPFAEEEGGSGGESLRKAAIYRYVNVEGSTRALMRLTSGDPLLSEAGVGTGRLFLFASSADLDWNDLPLKTAYLPLIQGLLKEAVGLGKESLPPPAVFGEALAQRAHPHQVAGLFKGLGIYEVPEGSGEVRLGVNPPFGESDLKKMGEGEIKKAFGAMNVSIAEYKEGALGGVRAARMEVWPFVLVFLLLLLGLEMGVANRIGQGRA